MYDRVHDFKAMLLHKKAVAFDTWLEPLIISLKTSLTSKELAA
jgi:hypothetical protein